MSQQKVRNTVIRSASLSLAGKEVAWPNKLFKPQGGLWFGVHYLPSDPRSVTLGLNGEDELRAILQIDVNVPTNSGEKEQMSAVNSLESFYTPGQVLAYEGQTARVLKCSRSSGRVVNTDWRVSVSVYIFSRYNRADSVPVEVSDTIASPEIELVTW